MRDGTVDVAFVRPPLSGAEGIAERPLVEEPLCIVLPAGHSQAGSTALPLSALAGEKLILFPREIGPGLYDKIIASCQQAGFSAELGQQAAQIPSIVHLVAAGFGIALVPQSLQQIHAEGVIYVPIAGDAPKAAICIATRKDDHRVMVRNFLTSST